MCLTFKFNVYGSVHHKYIPIYIQQDATLTQFIYIWKPLYMFRVVACAPDDGWRYHPKHVEQFPDINKLC